MSVNNQLTNKIKDLPKPVATLKKKLVHHYFELAKMGFVSKKGYQ